MRAGRAGPSWQPSLVLLLGVALVILEATGRAWLAAAYVEAVLAPPGVVHLRRHLAGAALTDIWLDTESHAVRIVRSGGETPEYAGSLGTVGATASYFPTLAARAGAADGHVRVFAFDGDGRQREPSGLGEARYLLARAAWRRTGGHPLAPMAHLVTAAAVGVAKGEPSGGDLSPLQSLFVLVVHESALVIFPPWLDRVDRAALPPEMFEPTVPHGWRASILRECAPEAASRYVDYSIYWAGPAVGTYDTVRILVSEDDPGPPLPRASYPNERRRNSTAVYAASTAAFAPTVRIQTEPLMTAAQRAVWEDRRTRRLPRPGEQAVRLGPWEGRLSGDADARVEIETDDAAITIEGARPLVIAAAESLRRLRE